MIDEGGEDAEENETKAHIRHEGLKQNRFLQTTLADFAIAFNLYDKAIEILDGLKEQDPLRHKFYEWRKSRVLLFQKKNTAQWLCTKILEEAEITILKTEGSI